MITKKIFLASSAELKPDRDQFEIFVNRENKDWVKKDVFLEVVLWEDFLDALSKTRLQDEYNKAIRDCDIFVMRFWTKVGKYTEEEFETAVGQFKSTNKPFVFSKQAGPARALLTCARVTSRGSACAPTSCHCWPAMAAKRRNFLPSTPRC